MKFLFYIPSYIYTCFHIAMTSLRPCKCITISAWAERYSSKLNNPSVALLEKELGGRYHSFKITFFSQALVYHNKWAAPFGHNILEDYP